MNIKNEVQKIKKSCIDYYDNIHQEYFEKFNDELEKKPYDKAFLIRLTGLLNKTDKILDVGCSSTAQQARFFRDEGFNVTSIDLSEKCIDTAKINFKGINFLQMDMLDLNFGDESFHAINAFYSIIHIPNENLDLLFSGFNRVLKSKGKLAIAVHSGDFYGYYEEGEVPVFYRTYKQDELKELLKKHSFSIIEIDQRQPIYDFEFKSERIYIIAEKI